MPDVVVFDAQRNWMMLIEAVTSHGPMDPKRREEFALLFNEASVGLVYVTAFIDRRTLGKYLADISWETEVWVAEAPTHDSFRWRPLLGSIRTLNRFIALAKERGRRQFPKWGFCGRTPLAPWKEQVGHEPAARL